EGWLPMSLCKGDERVEVRDIRQVVWSIGGNSGLERSSPHHHSQRGECRNENCIYVCLDAVNPRLKSRRGCAAIGSVTLRDCSQKNRRRGGYRVSNTWGSEPLHLLIPSGQDNGKRANCLRTVEVWKSRHDEIVATHQQALVDGTNTRTHVDKHIVDLKP